MAVGGLRARRAARAAVLRARPGAPGAVLRRLLPGMSLANSVDERIPPLWKTIPWSLPLPHPCPLLVRPNNWGGGRRQTKKNIVVASSTEPGLCPDLPLPCLFFFQRLPTGFRVSGTEKNLTVQRPHWRRRCQPPSGFDKFPWNGLVITVSWREKKNVNVTHRDGPGCLFQAKVVILRFDCLGQQKEIFLGLLNLRGSTHATIQTPTVGGSSIAP